MQLAKLQPSATQLLVPTLSPKLGRGNRKWSTSYDTKLKVSTSNCRASACGGECLDRVPLDMLLLSTVDISHHGYLPHRT